VSFFCLDLLDELPRPLLEPDLERLLELDFERLLALDLDRPLELDLERPLLEPDLDRPLLEPDLDLDLVLEPWAAISPPQRIWLYEIALPTSSAFLRAVRTSSVSSATCLLVFLNCLPAFLTCLATPFSPAPVPGTFMPSTFFGLLPRRVPRTTPPTNPAAAVATPVTTAAFDDPFPLDARAFPLFDELRAFVPELREPELRLPLREDADEVLRLDALALLGLLREAVPLLFDPLRLLLFEEPLRLLLLEALPLFGLDPFELRELACRLLVDPVLAWAIAPP
jgi:hypothetical protein